MISLNRFLCLELPRDVVGWQPSIDFFEYALRDGKGAPEAIKKEVMKDLYQVQLLDPIWGRATRLFDDLITALSA
uniref:Uncharacterized protein n=1 Tax=viral metagenome TaxID=1070528 RepID=A0A6C0IWK2_9ZZZZ